MSAIPDWQLEVDYIEACNCNFGCPCNFNGYPTDGKCEALIGYHIRKGRFGDLSLDGLDAIVAAAWPKAIHQGGGTVRFHVSEDATPEQRDALVQILSGQAQGNGPFALFAGTFAVVEDPVFAKIEMHIDGRNSRFRIDGIIHAELEAFTNPVSGDVQDIQIHMPQGFIFKTALAARSRVMKLLGMGPLSYDHTGRNAFFAQTEFAGP